MDRPVFHVRRGYYVVFFTAEYILPVVKASVDVELSVRHHMRLAVRYMVFGRENRVSHVFEMFHFFAASLW